MKKMMFMALTAGLFAFTSCSSDDDGESASSACKTCTLEAGGLSMETKYCDNGDGSYTQTDENATETTVDLPDGTTYSQFIAAQSAIQTCK
ncbi:hypothetical protein ACFQ3R_03910 [Mesonia ostreae]|uniref:Lipoprotein n=1 Tax=Mesonia ostreae TaxID=861110 RepID=A0ABU2KJ17_9FLAO|nr:hypothetical protein [Mesonia ostreae]MDT0294706.1 hypothetical protein [Mesonia ostreae]